MSKLLMIVGVVTALGGAVYWSGGLEKLKSLGTSEMNPIKKAEEAKEMMENRGIVSNLKDAMDLGTAMKCTYTADDSGAVTEAFIDGDKVHTKVTANGVTAEALLDNGTQYMWTANNKEGVKMEQSCMKALAEKLPNTTMEKGSPSPKDIQATFDTAKNVKCEPVVDADFSLPQGVTFTDQCAAMGEAMKMLDKMPVSSATRQ